MRNDPQGAVGHLTKSLAIYPKFVAAHNALGSAYLGLGQNDLAHAEFSQAIALDDHLPNSYLNLGCADLALKQYSAAEESRRKASSIAPLDVQLQLALAYGEFVNHDYPAVLATARQVHEHKHEGLPLFISLPPERGRRKAISPKRSRRWRPLLQEDPQSASAGQFRQILAQIKVEQVRRTEARSNPPLKLTVAFSARAEPTPEESARHAQLLLQEKKEENQIVEAEAAPDPTCGDCATAGALESPGASDPTHA